MTLERMNVVDPSAAAYPPQMFSGTGLYLTGSGLVQVLDTSLTSLRILGKLSPFLLCLSEF